MRDWNSPVRIEWVQTQSWLFKAYLWGIETFICWEGIAEAGNLKPTYEGLKLVYETQLPRIVWTFKAYLWGIETPFTGGHVDQLGYLKPTYEGLKLDKEDAN